MKHIMLRCPICESSISITLVEGDITGAWCTSLHGKPVVMETVWEGSEPYEEVPS